MNPEARINPELEQAIAEIRDESIPDATVDAAAVRVWERLTSGAAALPEHLRTCADFQALLPALHAGTLPEARAMLVRDHLRECVACRNVDARKVVAIPIVAAPRTHTATRLAVAAAVVATGGFAVWFALTQFGPTRGRAIIQTVHGTLYEVLPAGLRTLTPGELLRDGVEIRTARDSDAAVELADGSVVEMRERSDVSTAQTGSDLTVHLEHGSIIVQAAKRRSGHLYVATADCRVAVTGTVFGVTSGVSGSRVSVMEGEVHLTQGDREQVLHPGEQASTGDRLEPVSVGQDLAWSRNQKLRQQWETLRASLNGLHLPVRYSSRLVGLLPASTVFFASVPNLSQYLGDAEALFRRQSADSTELREWLSGPGAGAQAVLEKLRAANEYLGDEIIIFGTPETSGPVFLAEVKRDGFGEFLKKSGFPLPVEVRSGMVLFGPRKEALATALNSGFQKTPFYARIVDAYGAGAGLLLCADLGHMGSRPAGVRYLIAQQREIDGRMETRASLTLDGSHTGLAAWLAAPSPMGALDYVSSDATLVAAFAAANPAEILEHQPELTVPQPEFEVLKEAASALGGEVAVALDGPVFPVPAWKLVAEVYDPQHFRAALGKVVAEHDRDAAAHGQKPLRTAQEVVDGRTYYTIAGADTGPLTEAHYTFASGYLIAAPTRALLVHALEVKATGTGIVHSSVFAGMLPRNSHANFSAVVFQNLGTTLAPIAGLFAPKGAPALDHLPPSLITAYAEPGEIALASSGDLLGMKLNTVLSGSIAGLAGNALPWAQLLGTNHSRVPSR